MCDDEVAALVVDNGAFHFQHFHQKNLDYFHQFRIIHLFVLSNSAIILLVFVGISFEERKKRNVIQF